MTSAEQTILRILRSGKRADGKTSQDGHWVMRELRPAHPKYAQGPCAVLDVKRWDSPIIAQGATWEDVLRVLP